MKYISTLPLLASVICFGLIHGNVVVHPKKVQTHKSPGTHQKKIIHKPHPQGPKRHRPPPQSKPGQAHQNPLPQPQPYPYPLPQPYPQPYPVNVGPQPGGADLPQQSTVNKPGDGQHPLSPTINNSDEISEESGETDKNSGKAFQQVNIKFEWKAEHVQEKQGEMAPSDSVKQMVQKNASQIKNRANLPVITDEDRNDLNAAPVDALAFIHYQEGDNEIYLIKVIIGNQYVVHVKLAAKRLDDITGGLVHPDVENSVVMLVLPDKDEMDKLNRDEFDNPPKPE